MSYLYTNCLFTYVHTFIQIYSNYACVLRRTGHLDRAVEWYRLSLSLNPSDPDTHSSLGFTYHLLRRCVYAVWCVCLSMVYDMLCYGYMWGLLTYCIFVVHAHGHTFNCLTILVMILIIYNISLMHMRTLHYSVCYIYVGSTRRSIAITALLLYNPLHHSQQKC